MGGIAVGTGREKHEVTEFSGGREIQVKRKKIGFMCMGIADEVQ